jgi:hypothetical protein
MKCLTCKVNWFLNSCIFSNQGRAYHRGRYNKIKIECLPLGWTAQQWRVHQVCLQLSERFFTLLIPSKAFLKILKKGRHLSMDREVNQFNAVTLHVSCCSYFVVFGACMSRTVLTFSGFTSIPLCDTMNPKNFPEKPRKHTSWD